MIQEWSDAAWSYARWGLFLLVLPLVWLIRRSIDKEARLRRVEAAFRASMRTVADLVMKDDPKPGKPQDGL